MTRVPLAPGYDISRVLKGGWQLAGGHGAIDVDAALRDTDRYVDAGVTTFDCADIYIGVEALIGRWRQTRPAAAARVQIHTKYVPDLDRLPTHSRADVVRGIARETARAPTGHQRPGVLDSGRLGHGERRQERQRLRFSPALYQHLGEQDEEPALPQSVALRARAPQPFLGAGFGGLQQALLQALIAALLQTRERGCARAGRRQEQQARETSHLGRPSPCTDAAMISPLGGDLSTTRSIVSVRSSGSTT